MKNTQSQRTERQQKTYARPRNYTQLGRYLQEMRLRSNLTQREVSIALGYSSAQFISNFESGIASPPLKKMRQLVEMYKMPVDKLLALILEGEREILVNALKPGAHSRTTRSSRRAAN